MVDAVSNPQPPASSLAAVVHERGPLTVAAFMHLALYHPRFGYYSRSPQRSGRAGDFFTSVDVGPLFGELLAIQFEEMWRILGAGDPGLEDGDRKQNANVPSGLEPAAPNPEAPASSLNLVEAGAGNGRLSADILRAARVRDPEFYDAIHLSLAEVSPRARAAQASVLGDVADRLVGSSPELPESFEGVLFANELLDAMPVHQVVMREEGLREVFVAGRADVSRLPRDAPETLRVIEGAPSTPELAAYLHQAGVTLDIGARAEIGLAAVEWVRSAARRLRRGFVVLIDYGHEAGELYSAAHGAGTLTSFTRHMMAGAETNEPGWLRAAGEQDLTAHVDFTSVRRAAEAEGCVTLGLLDQTYFVMNLVEAVADLVLDEPRRRALKTLIMPGGLGSTMKVLVLGKAVGRPAVTGVQRGRLT